LLQKSVVATSIAKLELPPGRMHAGGTQEILSANAKHMQKKVVNESQSDPYFDH
jgi:hypothetical protein